MRRPNHLSLVVAALVVSACARSSEPLPIPAEPSSAPPSVELPRMPSVGTETPALDEVPWGLERVRLEQALAATDARYAPRTDETGPVLETPGSVVATFGVGGARVDFGGSETTLRVAAIGRGDSLTPVAATVAPVVAGPEVRTTIGDGIVEWWRSLPSGLEHGVTIAERPAGDGEFVFEIEVGGDLRARAASRHAVELVDASGAVIARYAHLVVLDAAGARVPARLAVARARIRFEVDDGGARYPLVIDPLLFGIDEARLLASGGATDDWFGWSVSLTADGSRALVGAPYDNTTGGVNAGSARVFLRTGTAWVEEATLLASGGAAGDYFGGEVALSADGSRALVGAVFDDTVGGGGAGSARVFLRTGTSWAEEVTLLASGGAVGDSFGGSVSLTADGSRALVGAANDDTTGGVNAGSARVFLRTGTSWAEEATLLASGGAAGDNFGSVSLTADGSRALVGAEWDDTVGGANAGSARVFLRTGTTWLEEATLLASGGAAFDYFGFSVSLTADGSRALVGASYDDTSDVDTGSARVFLRTGTSWLEDATLLASGVATNDRFGWSVSLTADGSRALVGAYGDNTAAGGTNAGSARVFSIVPLAANGTTCATGAACLSDSCTDGVCCDTACGGGAGDCQACSAALTGGAAGTCAPLSAAVASTVTCRASSDVCDPAETCSSASTTCPADVAVTLAGTVCRRPSTACDAAETCTGASAACPPDLPAPTGTPCRASAGTCDVREVCDGASYACAPDSVLPTSTVCRSVMGACDVEESCTGLSPACPADAVMAVGIVCRPIVSTCDIADVCDGASPQCVDLFASSTAICGAAPSGVCDAQDHCAGTSAVCVDTFLAGTECRASNGGCDPAEVCAGSSAACPPEAILPAGVSCRASTDATCDPEEMCDGIATACPADVTTCGPMTDGGAVDGGVPDGGASIDAPVSGADAGTPVAAAGCGCRASARDAPVGTLIATLLVVGVRRRPRRC